MRDKSISIVVPVYNGRKYLDELVMRITESTRGFKNLEIILVDDHSPDESFGKILAIASENPVVRGYLLEGNHGQQSAVLCGLSRASGDYVVIMDDDLENPPEAIPLMYEEMQKGFNAVYALDTKPAGRGLTRRTGSFIRDLTFRVLTDIPKGMKVCSYRMISSALCRQVAEAEGKFVYISMEMLKYTTNISNISIEYGRRKESGHSLCKLAGLILRIYIYYSRAGFLRKFRKPGPAYVIKASTERDRK